MKTLFAALAVLVTACGVDSRTDAFKEGFPRAGNVELKVPGSSSAQPLTSQGTRRDGLEGDTAVFYSFTRGVTATVNGAVAATLSLVERIVTYPATTVTAHAATWGPYTDPLSPNTWRFTVTRRAPNDFAYSLEGKGKTQADSEFREILSGTHVSAGTNYGNGSFVLNWDAASALPEHDAMVGTGQFTYARASAIDPTTIDATFTQVKDSDSGQLFDAVYHYAATPGQGGAFAFQMNRNFVGGPALELLAVNSRWLETGAGRADVRLTGTDVGASGATVNECWDSNFLSRYFANSFDEKAQWGTQTVCAFAAAEYARP